MTATDSHTLTNAQWLPVEAVESSPFQYRKSFDPTELAELAASIKTHGVLQAIVVRPVKNKKSLGITHQLIAGERRLRAAKMAGLASIPATVRQLSDIEALTLALIENVQRKDPDDWAIANGLKNLIELSAKQNKPMSLSDLQRATGKSIGYIRNHLDLFKLRPQLQEVAQKHNNVKSSLFEIQKIKPVTPTAAAAEQELISLVDKGAGFQEIKAKVEEHLEKEKWQRESWQTDKDSRRAQAEKERRSREAKREVEAALSDIESRIAHLNSWAGYLSTEDKERAKAKARRLSKALGQML